MDGGARDTAVRVVAPKWAVWSVSLNLFFIGLAVGWGIARQWDSVPPASRRPLQLLIQEMTSSGRLSPEGLKRLSDLTAELQADFTLKVSQTAPLRDRVRDLLVREPFDAVAFSRALDELFSEFDQDRSRSNGRVADVVGSLSVLDRQKLFRFRMP